MNNILQLKGEFSKQDARGFGTPNIPANQKVDYEHINRLRKDLLDVMDYWEKEQRILGALVSVVYNHVVAKSHRLQGLLCNSDKDRYSHIRGSRFKGDKSHLQHVFTYYVKLDLLAKSIDRLRICGDIVENIFGGVITHENLESIGKHNINIGNDISVTTFLKVISDCYYVEKFEVEQNENLDLSKESIVTLFKTDVNTKDLLHSIGINIVEPKILDGTTVLLSPAELEILYKEMPYMISMGIRDLNNVVPIEEYEEVHNGKMLIPHPNNEPIVGVIDTVFNESVYFNEWVDYHRILDKNIEVTNEDEFHGTAVSSIIVDGPSFNPELEDNCGRFRVRHFGVTNAGPFSSFTILREIRAIIASNADIKVWNLSLGSNEEINNNFISPEAAELDKIQSEYDVIFIIAGTNNKDLSRKEVKIGAPADSLNAIVVNSVKRDGNPASYHRVGPVLSFFHKPDLSYYGGDKNEPLNVCGPIGKYTVTGTSFAAPWITRKIAYMIYKLGLSREVAKALLIDSAAGWNRKDDVTHDIGYGIVPIDINKIVKSPKDEIKFVILGSSLSYTTYNYNIPIPKDQEKYPYYARATLCYFPKCDRYQGVDYTSTEMDLHFGRIIIDKKGKEHLKSINNNLQGEKLKIYMPEENARDLYRKWDNVKHIGDELKKRSTPRKSYDKCMWGLSIQTKERNNEKSGQGMPFGVVITLKEMNGVNRIDEFIKLCMARGWLVNSLDVENKVEVYEKAEEEVIFD